MGGRPSCCPGAYDRRTESEAAAREFFSPELAEQITGLYGVRPEIRFVEVAALIDDGAGVPA